MKKLWLAVFILFCHRSLYACAVCFGDPNSPMTHGARAAVWFMLGVVGVVLGGIAGVALYFVRRARLLQVQAAMRGEIIHL